MGKPKYILIVRHGESEGNCDKSVNRYTPNHLVPLTQNGKNQALQAGEALRNFLEHDELNCAPGKKNPKSIMFVTSPYLRTRQTCNNIIEGIKNVPGVEYKVREEPRMREQDFGNFQPGSVEMDRIWKERAQYGHFFYRIPHGESAADVYDRVASFNESLFRRFRDDEFPNILVLVSHGIWSRVFLMKWFKWSYEEFESLQNIPHCQFLIMKKNDVSQSYHLKTKLLTWDDSDDADIGIDNCQLNDHEVYQLIQDQREVFNSTKKKNQKIQDLYRKVHHSNTNSIKITNDKVDKFKLEHEASMSSVESFQ